MHGSTMNQRKEQTIKSKYQQQRKCTLGPKALLFKSLSTLMEATYADLKAGYAVCSTLQNYTL